MSLLDHTVSLASKLLSCASITPDVAGAQDVLADELRCLNFSVTRHNDGGVPTLWAVRGGSGPLVAFAGHTDVVPPGELTSWTSPPFEPVVRDGNLFGRGICDMKGGIAAFAAASAAFLLEGGGRDFRIGFLISGDEEADGSHGTRDLLARLDAAGERIDYCIVGEPSSTSRVGDTVRVGRRGSLIGRLTVRGVQGHSAFPEKARNSIHLALSTLAALAAHPWDQGDDLFPPTHLQITDLRSGVGASNVIPGKLEAIFNIRYSPLQTAETLIATCEHILSQIKAETAFQWTSSALPFRTAQGLLTQIVRSAIEARCGRPPLLSAGGGTSDARYINRPGTEVIELGLCNSTAHQVNECTPLADLEELAYLYLLILRDLSEVLNGATAS